MYGENYFNRNLGHVNIIVKFTNTTFILNEIDALKHNASFVILVLALAKEETYPAVEDKTGKICFIGEEDPCSPGTYYITLDFIPFYEIITGKKSKKNRKPSKKL